MAAVKAAGLVNHPQGRRAVHRLAPTNAAFDALPAGTVDTLLKPENKADPTQVLTYHVVPGQLDPAALPRRSRLAAARRRRPRSGRTAERRASATRIVLTDRRATCATVTTADVLQRNGVIHVIDKVLMPK